MELADRAEVFLLHVVPVSTKEPKNFLTIHLVAAARACVLLSWWQTDLPFISLCFSKNNEMCLMENLTASLWDTQEPDVKKWPHCYNTILWRNIGRLWKTERLATIENDWKTLCPPAHFFFKFWLVIVECHCLSFVSNLIENKGGGTHCLYYKSHLELEELVIGDTRHLLCQTASISIRLAYGIFLLSI